MSRSETHKAYEEARNRLAKLHPVDFARLYDEERAKRGLPSLMNRRSERIRALELEIERLKGQPHAEG